MSTRVNKHGLKVSTQIHKDLRAEQILASWVNVGAPSKQQQKTPRLQQLTGRPLRRIALGTSVEKNG